MKLGKYTSNLKYAEMNICYHFIIPYVDCDYLMLHTALLVTMTFSQEKINGLKTTNRLVFSTVYIKLFLLHLYLFICKI